MDQIKDVKSYVDLIEMLMYTMSQQFSITKLIKKEEDYETYLSLIEILLQDDGYASLVSITGWNKILCIVSNCRYDKLNITEEQFLRCNEIIFEINNRIYEAQEIEKENAYLSELTQELTFTLFPKKRKLIQAEIDRVNNWIMDYYDVTIQDSSQIGDLKINEAVSCFVLPQSLINESFLLDLLCDIELSDEAFTYLVQSPLTPYAMTRILNFLTLDEKDQEIFINIINAANDYITTGKTKVTYKNQMYVFTCTESKNDYSVIIKNDSYQRLSCYLKSIPYEKPKKYQKIKKR